MDDSIYIALLKSQNFRNAKEISGWQVLGVEGKEKCNTGVGCHALLQDKGWYLFFTIACESIIISKPED